jgi:hypothetical protein
MKTFHWILAGAVIATFAIVGCSKQGGVDTAPLENNFKAAEAAAQSSANKAVSAIKAGDYSGAMTELKTLAGNAKLTAEQQQAVKDVVSQVEKAVVGMADKAKESATKAADDLKKSLPK